jgi:hypothetical protein
MWYSAIMNLNEFLASTNRNTWIDEPHMRMYVRKSNRFLSKKTIHNSIPTTPCLDMASIEVDVDMRGKGVLTLFIKRFEREAKQLNRAVYVESILEPRLVSFLIKNGYDFVPHTCMNSPNMYKISA